MTKGRKRQLQDSRNLFWFLLLTSILLPFIVAKLFSTRELVVVLSGRFPVSMVVHQEPPFAMRIRVSEPSHKESDWSSLARTARIANRSA